MSSSAACEPKDLLTDVLSARVPPGFGDQVRAAARAAGVRPGDLIRRAVSERVAEYGVPPMPPGGRAAITAAAKSVLARAAEDEAFHQTIRDRVDAFRGAHRGHLEAAHRHLGTYLAQRRAIDEAEPSEGAEAIAVASSEQLTAAYDELEAARTLSANLAHIVLFGLES